MLLAYSNGLTALAYKRGHDPERIYLFLNPLLLLSLLFYATKRQGGSEAAGIRPVGLPKAVLLGLGAGLAFAYLRKRTDNLAAPIAAHWLTDSLMIAAPCRSAQIPKTKT